MGKVLIITLNYNQSEYTLKCIDSILMSDYDNFSILLIDNGSSEENFSELKRLLPEDKRIILRRIHENKGYVGGINFGLNCGLQEKPDYFLIMNNDTILDRNAISALVDTCRDFNNKAIVTGKVFDYDDTNRLQDIGYILKKKWNLSFEHIGFNEIDCGQYDRVSERDLIDDVFWLFPLELYHEIGGYSPHFWFNSEQADFALRAKSVSYKLVYTPYARIWHKGSVSIGGRDQNVKLVFWHIKSTVILRYLHLPRVNFLLYYLSEVTLLFISYIKCVFLGDTNKIKRNNAKVKGFHHFNLWLLQRLKESR